VATVGVDGLPLICLGTPGVECLLICLRVRGRHIGGAAPVLVFVEDVSRKVELRAYRSAAEPGVRVARRKAQDDFAAELQ
jgi:hypothetical protein